MSGVGREEVTGGPPELVTVDVWDTLLRRRCHPDCVKLHLSRLLMLRHWAELAPERRDPWTLMGLRQQAEGELGRRLRESGLDDEYRHHEVYLRWLELAGIEDGGRREALVAELEAAELAQERYVTYPDPHIAEILAPHADARRMFLSDFYLPAAAVRELLAEHGMDALAPEGVVSCEVGLNKRSGRLFSHLHEELDVAPGVHLHIGDNPHADVAAAEQLGISTIHFLPEREHGRRQRREARFADRAGQLRELSAELEEGGAKASAERAMYALGRSSSPLLVGFVLNLMERAVEQRLESLYFFTREGEFFLDLYQRLAEADVLGVPVPPARLLEVSRLATFAGSLREFSREELMRIWSQYSVQSMLALLRSLAIEAEPFAERAAAHGIELAEPIQYPWQDARVIAFLDDPAVRDDIEAQLAERRASLLAYLESAGLPGEQRRVGIVDIGWRGTIQDNLAHTLPELEVHGYYLAMNHFLNPQPENVRKEAFGPDLNHSEAHAELLAFVAPVEMLCNSPNGSVERYEITADGAVRVHRRVDEQENLGHERYVRHFQEGVMSTLEAWCGTIRTHAFAAAELRPMALEVWSGLIQRPPAALARAYFQLNHNETFGVGGFADKRRMISPLEVLLAMVLRGRRLRLARFFEEIGWVPGLLADGGGSAALRGALRLFFFAQGVKQRLRALLSRRGGA